MQMPRRKLPLNLLYIHNSIIVIRIHINNNTIAVHSFWIHQKTFFLTYVCLHRLIKSTILSGPHLQKLCMMILETIGWVVLVDENYLQFTCPIN